MGLGDWRARQQMRDPVRGVFRKTGFYDKHPASTPPGTLMTGVVIAPGVPAMAAEHRVDGRGRWAGQEEFPVLVDRADPARFAILWSELETVPWRDRELAYPAVQGPAMPQATIGQAMRAAAAGRPEIFGARGRQVPGSPAGGFTPDGFAPGGGFAPGASGDLLAHSVSTGGSAGQRASAVVAGVREVAIPPGLPAAAPGGVVDLALDITVPDGTRYTTITRVGFSTQERRLRIAAPGTQLTVLIDPADRSRVAIDTSDLS
jgi:hypothetical protein